MMTIGIGQPAPFPVVQGACALTLQGTFMWLIGDALTPQDGVAIRTGRVEMAFRRVEVAGKPHVYSAIKVPASPPAGGDTVVAFGDAVLEPLPADPKISYLCQLVAVDAPTQTVRAIRMFAFDRPIGELLHEVYEVHHAHQPTVQERLQVSQWVRRQPQPDTHFRGHASGDGHLRQRLG